MAVNGLFCADVPLSNYSLTHPMILSPLLSIISLLFGIHHLKLGTISTIMKTVHDIPAVCREKMAEG